MGGSSDDIQGSVDDVSLLMIYRVIYVDNVEGYLLKTAPICTPKGPIYHG